MRILKSPLCLQLVSEDGAISKVVSTEGWQSSNNDQKSKQDTEMGGVTWMGSIPVGAEFGKPGQLLFLVLNSKTHQRQNGGACLARLKEPSCCRRSADHQKVGDTPGAPGTVYSDCDHSRWQLLPAA